MVHFKFLIFYYITKWVSSSCSSTFNIYHLRNRCDSDCQKLIGIIMIWIDTIVGSYVQLFANPWTAAHQVSQSITISGACSNSCPLSRWCHPTISSSVVPFSSCLQSFPASGSFPVSQFFPSGDQSIGASASASVLPMNIQGDRKSVV